MRTKAAAVVDWYLRTSGGSFMEAKLRWVRLKAELKNWRNSGSVSFTLLWEDGGRWRENKEVTLLV